MPSTPPSTGHPDHDRSGSPSWAQRVEQMGTEDLRLLATSLPVIEQAKGILMGHYGCEATTAFTILQRWSSVEKIRLRDLADALVEEASRTEAHPPGGERLSAVERFLRRHGLA